MLGKRRPERTHAGNVHAVQEENLTEQIRVQISSSRIKKIRNGSEHST